MVPSSLVQLLVAVGLIPGFLFLRLTEKSRHPRNQSGLADVVEVLASGLASVSFVVVPILLAQPDATLDVLAQPREHVRVIVLLAILVVVGSCGAALVMARLVSWLRPPQFGQSVWAETFLPKKHGFIREVLVEVEGRRRFQGKLMHFTLDPTLEQQIVLGAPLYRVLRDGSKHQLLGDKLAFSGGHIVAVLLRYTPEPEAYGRTNPREDGLPPPD